MSSDEQPDALHTALARRIWRADPTVRLHHDPADESLVAEIVSAPSAVEVAVHEHLVVDLDGTGAGALPTTLYLGAVRSAPDGPAARRAREILGEQVWAAAEAMVASGTRLVDVPLGTDEATARLAVWRRLASEPCAMGVEFTPGRLYAVLVDEHASVLDEEVLDLTGNEPDDVVAGVDRLVRTLAARHPGTAAETCPIGVQLGGPVHTDTGVVEFYAKPRRGRSDASWWGVPLGEMLDERTGRAVQVSNDAQAFATWERDFGAGRRSDRVVVLIVRDGVGAKLLDRGEVSPFPMEIGVFLHEPGADGTPRAIEADSGVSAILDAVARVVGRPVLTIRNAADEADRSDDALAAFTAAGRALARCIAVIQSMIGPDRYVIIGPRALVGEDRISGRAFLRAARKAHEHLGYDGLWPGQLEPRVTTGSLGARAAAWMAVPLSGTIRSRESDLRVANRGKARGPGS